MKEFHGAVAVVTGGSSGIGRRLCVDLARRGASVVAVGRRAGALADVANELRASSPTSSFLVCDVSDTDAYRASLAETETRYGHIDILVNGAAMEQRTSAEDGDLEIYRRTMETNFFAVVAGTLAVLPGMLARGSGVIVNVSSDSGRAPTARTPAYAASKAAVSAFSESVAHEVAPRGVHVHVLYPGWVPTPMGRKVIEQGMPRPPRVVRRSERQVSRAVLSRMGGHAIDINVARVATLAPVVRSLAPRLYRRQMAHR